MLNSFYYIINIFKKFYMYNVFNLVLVLVYKNEFANYFVFSINAVSISLRAHSK